MASVRNAAPCGITATLTPTASSSRSRVARTSERPGTCARRGSGSRQIRAGLIDPKDLAMREHDARPLANHIRRLARLPAGQGFDPPACRPEPQPDFPVHRAGQAWPDFRADSLEGSSRVEGDPRYRVSLRSIHHYTRAVKGFSRWLWRDGRAREDTLAHLTSQNPDADRRRIRRALEPEELVKAIRAAEQGPVVLKTTGPDRAMLYQLAMGTGFRANELRTLTPEAFDLAGDQPTITVKAAYSKRRRDDVQPIQPELATPYAPGWPPEPPASPCSAS